MIIAIDFDGTICRGIYPNIDGLQPDAKQYIQKLKDDGHYIIIYTCRSGDYLTQAINWLLANEIPFDRVNDNEPQSVELYKNNSRKVYAHVYVDDKQVGGLPPWGEIYKYITEKENEYQQTLSNH
ncbi:HAD hydrolase family protein [Capnocytophaga canis]|uniref:HAD hydrolase family protein n=1 Tax=Capnocytophaga canis TaxID=1848903 RepID=UPI00385CDCF4